MTSVTVTERQAKRIQADWSKIAGEVIEVDSRDLENMFAFGSELACLKLAYAFRNTSKELFPNFETKVAYSDNLKVWYFNLRK